MAAPYFCTYDVGPMGTNEPCRKPTKGDGKAHCDAHRTRQPIWPLNDDGTPCTPEPGLLVGV